MRYWPLYVMLLPCIVYYALICYVPMAGSVLAFKDYSFKKGIWGSPWVGFDYFKTFFKSYDAGRLIRNTLAIGIITVSYTHLDVYKRQQGTHAELIALNGKYADMFHKQAEKYIS